jgi:hypothetical protein
MRKTGSIIKNERGSVMVAALLVLLLLTIIGISAIRTSNTELNITVNTQLHKMAFFMAESGWHVMTDWLDDQYPLPTLNLASEWTDFDGDDNDGDGETDEIDEQMQFGRDKFDGVDNDGDGETDEHDEVSDFIPFSSDAPNYRYRASAAFAGAGIAAGWDPTMFLRYNYTVTSTGNVPALKGTAVSQITVTVGKIQER